LLLKASAVLLQTPLLTAHSKLTTALLTVWLTKKGGMTVYQSPLIERALRVSCIDCWRSFYYASGGDTGR